MKWLSSCQSLETNGNLEKNTFHTDQAQVTVPVLVPQAPLAFSLFLWASTPGFQTPLNPPLICMVKTPKLASGGGHPYSDLVYLWLDWILAGEAPASAASSSAALQGRQSTWSPWGSGCGAAGWNPAWHLDTHTQGTWFQGWCVDEEYCISSHLDTDLFT